MSAELLTPTAVMVALVHHQGADQGVSCKVLVEEIAGLYACKADERRLRTIIEQLRRDGHGICGTPETGYFLARNDAELVRTCNFLYERAMTSLAQIAAMRRVELPDLRGQLRLPALPHPLPQTHATPEQKHGS